jgi:hypothetical protein
MTQRHLTLGSASLGETLVQAIYTLAEEGADEVIGPDAETGHLWAALIRDGAALAGRIRDEAFTGDLDAGSGGIDASEWTVLENAAGVIVTRDDQGAISVEPFATEEELAAAWAALTVDVEPGEPGPPTVESPESDDNPT